MVQKAGNYKIPFDAQGNQLTYYHPRWDHDVTLVDNFKFTDTLTLDGMSRGQSAAHFQMKRKDGTQVTVFMTDLCDMIPKFCNGEITGEFTFVKRGQNYGCALLT